MKDPHVRSLTYRLETQDPGPIEFAEPLKIYGVEKGWRWELEAGLLTIWPTQRYEGESDARAAVRSFLRCWEIQEAARYGSQVIHFLFVNADVTKPPLSDWHRRGIVSHVSMTIPSRQIAEYPAPPRNMVCSPELDLLFGRFEAAIEGRENLLAMSYLCLTYMKTEAGGEGELKERVRVSTNVLEDLGRIVSSRGDLRQARKMKRNSDSRPLAAEEQNYVRVATCELIRRWASTDPSQLSFFTRANLPSLGRAKRDQ